MIRASHPPSSDDRHHGAVAGARVSTPGAEQPAFSVLLYGLNYEPELTGIGKYSGEMARWLALRGHRVQVVTAPPYYPEWAIREGYVGWRYSTDQALSQDNLRVLRCPLWVPKKVSGKTRMLHLISFAITSFPALLWQSLRQRPAVIMLVVPTLACAPGAWLVGKLTRTPVWLHVQDFEVDAMHAMGLGGRGKTLQRVALGIESWLMRRFDRVSSISQKMVERLAQKGVDPRRIVEFPNWVDVSTIHPLHTPRSLNPCRQLAGLPEGATVVLYAGNLGQKQGIEVVLDAARALQAEPRIQFVMVGAGAAEATLKAHAADLKNVRWLPLQPLELLNDLLNMADIHVLPQRADAADLVMPSKLTGMLASGKPVIGTATLETQLGQVLAECGVRVEPGDAAALTAAIRALAVSPQEQARLGAMGRQHALAHLSHEAVLGKFEQAVHALIKSQPAEVTA
ncbi:MAG: glycosyltransferase WbuB [Gammaproteobacteria bacterium]|nr:glycosyltransferase WbuB [Gammaproteobacteria bacterium]